MIKISVIIDSSGSMSVLSKNDIIQNVCRNLLLHENLEFKFYSWSDSVKEISYEEETLPLNTDGKSNLFKLAEFIRNKNSENILLLTNGFFDFDEDCAPIKDLISGSEKLNFRLVGIGADFDEVLATRLFPKNLIAVDKDKFLFTALDLEAVLESFCATESDEDCL